jgi:hypothetical protein
LPLSLSSGASRDFQAKRKACQEEREREKERGMKKEARFRAVTSLPVILYTQPHLSLKMKPA